MTRLRFGVIGLGYWGLGFRNATNSSRPIARVEDFSGLKLRVIPNPVYLETFKAFKANPVPMAFGELYTALLKGRQGGWLSPNDCRAETGFPTVADGDDIAVMREYEGGVSGEAAASGYS